MNSTSREHLHISYTNIVMCVIYTYASLHNNTFLEFCTIIYIYIYIPQTQITYFLHFLSFLHFLFIFLSSFRLLAFPTLFFTSCLLRFLIVYLFFSCLPLFLSLIPFFRPLSLLPYTTRLQWRYLVSQSENKHILSQVCWVDGTLQNCKTSSQTLKPADPTMLVFMA